MPEIHELSAIPTKFASGYPCRLPSRVTADDVSRAYIFFNGIKRPIHTTINASPVEPRAARSEREDFAVIRFRLRRDISFTPVSGVKLSSAPATASIALSIRRLPKRFRFPRSDFVLPHPSLRLVFAWLRDERRGDKVRVMLWFHRGGRGHVT